LELLLSRFWWDHANEGRSGKILRGHQRGSASTAAHQRIEKDIFNSNPYELKSSNYQ
jgi:hypothetical protein